MAVEKESHSRGKTMPGLRGGCSRANVRKDCDVNMAIRRKNLRVQNMKGAELPSQVPVIDLRVYEARDMAASRYVMKRAEWGPPILVEKI